MLEEASASSSESREESSSVHVVDAETKAASGPPRRRSRLRARREARFDTSPAGFAEMSVGRRMGNITAAAAIGRDAQERVRRARANSHGAAAVETARADEAVIGTAILPSQSAHAFSPSTPSPTASMLARDEETVPRGGEEEISPISRRWKSLTR
ncbi:hypothetical protein CDD83_5000 [Cordyceps sp. RAO-2017]|nr:hypothetical protein CDD83_5000 [Cordyceps sp. RAO-2017]